MIIQLILQILIGVLSILFGWLPVVDTLPFGMDEILVDGIGSFKSLMLVIPPLEILFNAFMVYLSFRVLLVIVRFVMGSRTPQHD